MKTRRAVFAGSWYPDSPDGCEHEIRNFLKGSTQKRTGTKDFTGGIVPHAGWYFSGKIACEVIASAGRYRRTGCRRCFRDASASPIS